MKIAILGKGGSGKSSTSWLLAKHLSNTKNIQTLAIDSDHNMDLTSCLSVDSEKVPFLKDFNSEFRTIANMPQLGMWKQYFEVKAVDFCYPNDPKLAKYIVKVNTYLDLIVAGLGDQNLMLTNKCSHALSAPVKYMMPTLTLNNSWIVLDSVAGSDMLNYGIYFGFDVLCCVVEGHINSIKVANQLKNLANKQGLKMHFILNKYNSSNQLIQEFELENKELVVGKISSDLAILDYSWDKIRQETLQELETIIQNISKIPKPIDSYQKLKAFELAKI